MSDFRSQDPYLRNRYGLNQSDKNWKTSALVILLIGMIWTTWSGLSHATPEIRSDLISFKPIDSKSISVRFTMHFKTVSKPHSCTFVARDFQANVVGEKIIDFPAGTRALDQTVIIPTRLAAVNAEILGCQVR